MTRRGSLLAAAGCLLAQGQGAQAATAPPPAAVEEVVVTAQRLDQARQTIEPSLGASTYSLPTAFIDGLPGGANSNLSQVVLKAPGAAQDSFGQLHIRGDHANLQYRLNGAILPEGLNLFGQTLSPRLAGDVQLITGALPAQYGLRTAGVINITTKSGLKPGGEIGLYGGSHGLYQPSIEAGGTSGGTSGFVSADVKHSDLGIEAPTAGEPRHDRTDQVHGFAYVDHILDSSSRVSLILGVSDQRFQIPNTPGLQPDLGLTVNGQSNFPSAQINETQRETTQYAIASYLHDSDRLTTQVSVFGRRSALTYRPDPVGDLLYDGIAQDASKRDLAAGLQGEGVYRLGVTHTLRGGLVAQAARDTSRTSARVLATDANGVPLTDQPSVIADNSRQVSRTYSLFLQDEWKLASSLTLNYGLRYDVAQAVADERQLSPRVNLVWTPATGSVLHAGYARYFTPAPTELVADAAVSRFQNTTAASAGTLNRPPSAETADYWDVGFEQRLGGGLTLGIDSYYKKVRNLLDEGQFGAPIILTPFNYRDGRVYGVEFTGAYNRGPFSSYANLAFSRARGRDIVSSQFNFDPADLAYIAAHYIPLDHDQTYTASAGASYRWGGSRFGADLIYGSGLRADGATPNGRNLPGYTQIDLAVSHRFQAAPLAGLQLRFDVVNLLDKVYEIRDGSGVGVGAPQFGPRRGYFVGVSRSF